MTKFLALQVLNNLQTS